MKTFSNKKQENVLLIEREDINNTLISRLRGNHVNYVIAPIELRSNEQFLRQITCNISIDNIYFGQVLYYE